MAHISTYLQSTDEKVDDLVEFVSHAKNEYGEGMSHYAVNCLYNEWSEGGCCSFFEPYYVGGDVLTLNRELAGQRHPVVVSGPINVYGDEEAAPVTIGRLI